MKHLKLAKDLSLPLEAATETFAILGRRGSGKTHTAVVMAEEMLAAGVQVVVIDPLDVWWGLRVSKDGKTAGVPIYVCGGSHADVPLTADAGKVLADAIVERGLSMVLSLRHLSKTDQRRFVGDFCDRLYDQKADPKHRTALHVFIDEADAFVPQRIIPGSERCFGAVDTLVRRGRSSGLAPTLISQRPQVINKDVLSQTEVLVSHQLTGPQDRKALQAWIEANDTENRGAEFMASLASLQKGHAWFWSPGLLGIFTRVHIRDRHTFDSSATPKAGGMATAAPKTFAKVDLQALTAEIAATIEKAKADDPRELRKQIADLKKQVAKVGNIITPEKTPKRVEVLTDDDRAQLVKLADLAELLSNDNAAILESVRLAAVAAVGDGIAMAESDRAVAREAFIKRLELKGFQKILDKLSTLNPQPSSADIAAFGRRFEAAAHRDTPRTAERTTPARQQERQAGAGSPGGSRDRVRPAGEGKPGTAQRAFLTVLAHRDPKSTTRNQLAVFTGYSAKSSHVDNTISSLRTAGWILGGRDAITITESGLSALGSYEPLPTGRALVSHWVNEAGAAAGAMLKVLVQAYPNTMTRDEVADATGYSGSSSHVDNSISRLRTLQLVTGGRQDLRASEELFL